MSMRDKLLKAASFAVTEERGRVLWCIDQVIVELKGKLNKAILSTVQIEAAKMKLKIAEAVCIELRRAVVSGVRPLNGANKEVRTVDESGVTGQADPAGFSPPSGAGPRPHPDGCPLEEM